jgi:predicted amidohydrolase YtcJ
MLIERAELAPGHIRDVRIVGARITEVADRLRPRGGEDAFDARGNAVLPGLHDHHVHLRALAAAIDSVDLRSVRGRAAFEDRLRNICAERHAGGWVRVVGYHESIAGPLDRAALDRLTGTDTPVRVQHRSGAQWVLNTAAIRALELDSHDGPGVDINGGHLLRRDDLVRRVTRLDRSALARLGATALAAGVTGFTDATPDGTPDDARTLARELRDAGIEQNLMLMAPVGAAEPDEPRAELGPVKVLLDDHVLPSLDDLATAIADAHAADRAVAVHCVTRVQFVLTLAALDTAGRRPGDRIEHGSVIPSELIGQLVDLGLTVVTQPHFVAERGDQYLESVDPDDLGSLYRVRSLQGAGVAVAAGTDAPFGAFDPWASMAAAVARTSPAGHVLGPDERISPRQALDLYLGDPRHPGNARTVDVGAPADLCVLDRPWRDLLATADCPAVRATVIAGRVVHLAP